MKKVLCIAECCCDLIFAGLPEIPALGQEIYCREFALKAGGGANTPMSLARLGVPSAMITRIGGDPMGSLLLDSLRKAGVRLHGQIGVGSTDVSAVLSTREDRCFASYGSGGCVFDEAVLEEQIRQADIVHTYLGYCYSYPIARLAARYGKLLSLDTSWVDAQNPTQALQVLKSCHYVKMNQVEARCLTGEADPLAALQKLSRLVQGGVVVTLGGQGSMGMTAGGREAYTYPALTMGAFRDSCGAGDNYAAGFLYGLAQEKGLADCMALGAKLSGLSVTWLGGNDDTLNCTKIDAVFQV